MHIVKHPLLLLTHGGQCAHRKEPSIIQPFMLLPIRRQDVMLLLEQFIQVRR